MPGSSEEIVLFDLPCQDGQLCWSPNVWKIRLLLNYKAIPYTTCWVDFPDIAATLQSRGAEPQHIEALGANTGAQYTLPAVQFPDGKIFMDSSIIASEIQNRFPEPALALDPVLDEQAQKILQTIARPLYPELSPHICYDLLTNYGRDHWLKPREKLFGMPIDEYHKHKGGAQAWEAAEPGLRELSDFLKNKKKDSGPYVLGSKVSFADLVVVAMFKSVSCVKEEFLQGLLGDREELKRLWDASQDWMQKNT